ncbi:acyltransferase family protein [Pontibacter mangrovi]|uniref:Acyltransferase n=1 Tax=Pontibacter mangrovi TaxID=2589816 RepID=A0A501WBI1_9BACT|nr:acyltransferase [Pontibacter mangrovi]TPE45875.1 acyltransferase [Pontibacter mangrovi]
MKRHFQQIDVIKGVAILAVLLLHSFTRQQLEDSYAVYHIWQAVPLFMVVMGLNLGISVQGKEQRLGQLYTRKYFTKKAARIFVPFLIIFIASILAGLLWEAVTQEKVLEFNGYTWLGVLPVTGRGNYFITLLLQSVLLLPIMGYGFARAPVITTALLVLLEIAFQLWASSYSYFDANNYLYDAAFPRYFSAVAFGFWLSRLLGEPFKGRHFIFLGSAAFVAIVVLYLLVYDVLSVEYLVRPEWQLQQPLTFGYAAMLVWLGLKLLPSTSSAIWLQLPAELGKASYHIFLVQVVYFGLADQDLPVTINLLLPVSLGYLFFKYEKTLLFGKV